MGGSIGVDRPFTQKATRSSSPRMESVVSGSTRGAPFSSWRRRTMMPPCWNTRGVRALALASARRASRVLAVRRRSATQIKGRSSSVSSCSKVGAAATSAWSSSGVCPASSQSLMSPFSASPGSSMSFAVIRWAAHERATSCWCLAPAASLSRRITASRHPAVLSYCVWTSLHFPAPLLLHVAGSPSAASRSASFSPFGM